MDRNECPQCGTPEGHGHHPACSYRHAPQSQRDYDRQMQGRMMREQVFPDRYFVKKEDLSIVDHGSLVFQQPAVDKTIQFMDDNGETIGSINVVDRQLRFEGNMDDSAKQFAKMLSAHFQSIIEGDRDGVGTCTVHVDPAEEEEPQKVWPEHVAMPGALGG